MPASVQAITMNQTPLTGVNVNQWYASMAHSKRNARQETARLTAAPRQRIDAFYATRHCAVCEAQCSGKAGTPTHPLCDDCAGDPQWTLFRVIESIRDADRASHRLKEVSKS